MGFVLDLLFKVTEVKLQKYAQCDTTSQLITIAYIFINFSHWIHLTRVCLMQSE
jgi:hypothetical protein